VTITVGRLRSWDAAGLRAAGAALRGAAEELDQLARRVAARSADAWSGVAADAAEQRARRVRVAIADVAAGITACGAVLIAAADALEAARHALDRAARHAADAMLRLDDDGTVAVPPVEPGLPPELFARAQRLHAAREQAAAAATALAQQALAAGAEADRDAACALEQAGRFAGVVGPAGLCWLATWEAALVPAVRARDLPPPGCSATDVAAWWSSLSPAQRDIAMAVHPDRLGRLDGLPSEVRHRANVAVLDRERAALQAALAAQPAAGRLAALLARLATVQSIIRQLAGDPARRRLLLLDIDGGRAAIAIGDVDRADHVALVVPGLEQDVAEDMDAIVYNADRLRRTAEAWLGRLAPHEFLATVAWLGYATPSWRSVASTAHAERGAPQLRAALRGLHAARTAAAVDGTPLDLHLTVVGHSYGSLAAAVALREPTGTDDAVLVGSPGVGTTTAAEVGVPAGHVFVGESTEDDVAELAWFGADPGGRDFGAATMQTDGGVDPVSGAELRATRGHSEYFDLHTESVRNIALVAIGQAHLVTYAGASDLEGPAGPLSVVIGSGLRW